jgi:Alginate lyase
MAGRFLSETYIADIRAKVAGGKEPWAAGHKALIAAADVGLTQAPLSVRDNGGSPYFRVDAIYVTGKDGVMDASANMDSRTLAAKTSKVSLDLALAWRFTDAPRYADKALELIHAWCINRSTYMFPTGRTEDSWTQDGKYGGDIVMFHSFWDLFLAAYLLQDYPGWNLLAHSAVKRWVKDMIDPQRPEMFFQGREMYNNWEDARLLYLARGALVLDDLELLTYVFNRWQHVLPIKMTDEGELHRETMRTRSMTYTLASISSTLEIAEIARCHGVDLYDLSAGGKCFKTAVDYAAKYLLDMDSWPFEMIHGMADLEGNARLGSFELAYRQWGETSYLDVLSAYGGRPVAGTHATLLYGAE